MKVKEVMTKDVRLIAPSRSIAEAAKMMAEADTGILPVAENDRLVGTITDRDIVIRAVAKHLPPGTLVRDVMSKEVLYCYEDDDVEQVARNMGENQVRRLPALNRDKRLVGIVSISDLSRSVSPPTVGETIADISKPGGAHSQRTH